MGVWCTYAVHQPVNTDVLIFFQCPRLNTYLHLFLPLNHAFTHLFLDLFLTLSKILVRNQQHISEMSYLITPIHTALFLHFSPLLLESFSWVEILVESSRDFESFPQISFVVISAFTLVLNNPKTCSFSTLVGSSCKGLSKVVPDFFY